MWTWAIGVVIKLRSVHLQRQTKARPRWYRSIFLGSYFSFQVIYLEGTVICNGKMFLFLCQENLYLFFIFFSNQRPWNQLNDNSNDNKYSIVLTNIFLSIKWGPNMWHCRYKWFALLLILINSIFNCKLQFHHLSETLIKWNIKRILLFQNFFIFGLAPLCMDFT